MTKGSRPQLLWRWLSAFLYCYRSARKKKHGAGRSPLRQAIKLARCGAWIAAGRELGLRDPILRIKPGAKQ